MKIKLPIGFRFLSKTDEISSFDSKTPALDEYIRQNVLNWIDDPTHLVVVNGVKKEIWGLVDLQIYAEHVELAVLARNKSISIPQDVRVGSRLAHLAKISLNS